MIEHATGAKEANHFRPFPTADPIRTRPSPPLHAYGERAFSTPKKRLGETTILPKMPVTYFILRVIPA